MNQEAQREAWLRQPEESFRCYANFSVFRDLPPQDRSLAMAALKLRKKISTIREQSAKYQWFHRASAYDDWAAEQEKKVETQDRDGMYRRHIKSAMYVQHRVMQRFARLTEEEVNALAPGQLIYMLESAIRVEATAREARQQAMSSERNRVEFIIHAPLEAIPVDSSLHQDK